MSFEYGNPSPFAREPSKTLIAQVKGMSGRIFNFLNPNSLDRRTDRLLQSTFHEIGRGYGRRYAEDGLQELNEALDDLAGLRGNKGMFEGFLEGYAGGVVGSILGFGEDFSVSRTQLTKDQRVDIQNFLRQAVRRRLMAQNVSR